MSKNLFVLRVEASPQEPLKILHALREAVHEFEVIANVKEILNETGEFSYFGDGWEYGWPATFSCVIDEEKSEYAIKQDGSEELLDITALAFIGNQFIIL